MQIAYNTEAHLANKTQAAMLKHKIAYHRMHDIICKSHFPNRSQETEVFFRAPVWNDSMNSEI